MSAASTAWLDHSLSFSVTLFLGKAVHVAGADADRFLGVVGFNLDGQDLLDASIITSADMPRIASRTGLPVASLNEAYALVNEYRFCGGLLQRRLFSKVEGLFTWYTVIPYSPFRAVEFAGRKHRCDLRRLVVLTYHIAPMSGHRGRQKTIEAIMTSGLWWNDMSHTVNQIISGCWECKREKAVPYVSGLSRSRDYDGPFRFLIIDFVGPIRPPTARGFQYLFTCTCAFSGWYWAIPTVNSDAEDAAQALAERVIFDLAGVPVYLSSDNGRAFVKKVIATLATRFGMSRVLGSAFHPQSQGVV